MVKKLDLHIGGGNATVSREGVWAVQTPLPKGKWYPISHERLLSTVEGRLRRTGLEVVNEAHVLAHQGARYFGLLQVAPRDAQDGDHSLVLGLRNSHDQSIVAGLAVGAGVHVCSNLSFSSDIRIDRKHTRWAERDLPRLVEVAIGRLGDHRRTQEARICAYKGREMSDTQAHDIVIQALDTRVLPVTRIPDVLEEWRNPRHAEFSECGRTAWRLFNAFTECLKGSNLFSRPAATQALHGLMDTACGLALSSN